MLLYQIEVYSLSWTNNWSSVISTGPQGLMPWCHKLTMCQAISPTCQSSGLLYTPEMGNIPTIVWTSTVDHAAGWFGSLICQIWKFRTFLVYDLLGSFIKSYQKGYVVQIKDIAVITTFWWTCFLTHF